MAGTEISQNYATALIDSLATPADIERVTRDLETFGALMGKIASLPRVLAYPGFSQEKRLAILDEVLAKTDPHPVTRRFLRLVIEKDRLDHLGEILREFAKLSDARRNITPAEVVTAAPLDEAARAALEKKLAALAGGAVRVTWRTDAALVGGVVTRVGSKVYDGSVRKQLDRIRDVLLQES